MSVEVTWCSWVIWTHECYQSAGRLWHSPLASDEAVMSTSKDSTGSLFDAQWSWPGHPSSTCANKRCKQWAEAVDCVPLLTVFLRPPPLVISLEPFPTLPPQSSHWESSGLSPLVGTEGKALWRSQGRESFIVPWFISQLQRPGSLSYPLSLYNKIQLGQNNSSDTNFRTQ